jgi:hypothetical protein
MATRVKSAEAKADEGAVDLEAGEGPLGEVVAKAAAPKRRKPAKAKTTDVPAVADEPVADEPVADEPAAAVESAVVVSVAMSEASAYVDDIDDGDDVHSDSGDGGDGGAESDAGERGGFGSGSMAERAELGVVITRQLCVLMGIGVDDVKGDVDGDTVVISIDGVQVDEGALDSRAFESMQFLLNKAVHKSGGRRSRLALRVDGFRSRRREPVDRLAQALAQKAQRLGKVLTLGPLDPTDIRLWTVALQRQQGAQIATVGPNETRRIVIAPEGVEADANGRGRRRRRRRRKN